MTFGTARDLSSQVVAIPTALASSRLDREDSAGLLHRLDTIEHEVHQYLLQLHPVRHDFGKIGGNSKSAEGNLVGVRPPPGTNYRAITMSLIGWATLFLSSLRVLSRGLDIKPNSRRDLDPKGCQVGHDFARNGRSTDPFSRPFAATNIQSKHVRRKGPLP